MPEELERESVEVEPQDVEALASLMDEEGNLPAHGEREEAAEEGESAEPHPENNAPQQQATDKPASQEQAVEVEYEGKKFRVPPELKDAILRQSDYTRKTQEVAQARAAVEQERQAAARFAQEAQQYVGHFAALQQIDSRLQQLQQVDPQRLQSDPLFNLEVRQQWTELNQARSNVLQQVAQAQQQQQARSDQQTRQQLQAIAQHVEQGQQALAKDIPEWGADLQQALAATGQSVGYKPEELAAVTDPRAVKLLHKAYLYDQLQAQKTVAAKQVKQAPPKVVRPSSSQGPNETPPRNEGLLRLRKSGRDDDAVAALRELGF